MYCIVIMLGMFRAVLERLKVAQHPCTYCVIAGSYKIFMRKYICINKFRKILIIKGLEFTAVWEVL